MAVEERRNHQPPPLSQKKLASFVANILDGRELFLKAADRFASPLYIIDADKLTNHGAVFKKAFEGRLAGMEFYYAVKSNNHPFIAKQLTKEGFGLDVSSGVELQTALELGADRIVFSGPGKTVTELETAVRNADRVTVHLDSFRELERLNAAAAQAGRVIRAGVRLTTEENGLWRKFGIPLSDLPGFFEKAKHATHVDFSGLQFHTSWNMTPEKPVAFIKRLGETLSSLGAESLSRIEFIDIGGGYWPEMGEWLLAENRDPLDHRCFPATPIEDFAMALAETIQSHIFPHVDCTIFTEPGRWICNDAMHILVTVVDKKNDDLVITDGGTNMVGWERFETDYFPVINLTRPALAEQPCMILGSLCTPHDVWGYAFFGKKIGPGDRLLIPTQGAYTYSLRQDFIKALPKTVAFQGKDLVALDS
jgi:diaminopimelate decarboxylase